MFRLFFQTTFYLVTANGDAATHGTSKYLAMNQPSQAKRLKTMASAPRQARKLPCISIIRSCCWLLEKPRPLHTWSLKQKKIVYLSTWEHIVLFNIFTRHDMPHICLFKFLLNAKRKWFFPLNVLFFNELHFKSRLETLAIHPFCEIMPSQKIMNFSIF